MDEEDSDEDLDEALEREVTLKKGVSSKLVNR